MRLIDADALMEAMRKFEKEAEEVMTCPSWWSAYNVIKEQPTAFDVEKVLEELEKNSHNEFSHAYGGNYQIISVYDAIDIVKKGGVS